MPKCIICNNQTPLISKGLSVCLKCIRTNPEKALEIANKIHERSRNAFGLPPHPPESKEGIGCNICVNECRMAEGQRGYCGLRYVENHKLKGVTKNEGKLSWYLDPLPTNCVADWVCAGGTGAGYPKYSYTKGAEYGYFNLAVFFHACSMNCLYCQNWHFRELTLRSEMHTIDELLKSINQKVSCICYFGGDPTPQLPFSIEASKRAIELNRDRILRVCWETNGTMNKNLLKTIMEISLQSGGCVKFDLKAWNEDLHKALTGVTNSIILENFKIASEYTKKRQNPPVLVASTLLVPGYIDEEEIRNISRFIASLNPEIPYSLLAFYPHFYMDDLPLIKKDFAYRCLEIAKSEGLKNVRIGNIHLLRPGG